MRTADCQLVKPMDDHHLSGTGNHYRSACRILHVRATDGDEQLRSGDLLDR